MRTKIIIGIVSLFFFYNLATVATTCENDEQIQDIQQQTERLIHKVNCLQAKLCRLEKNANQKKHHVAKKRHYPCFPSYPYYHYPAPAVRIPHNPACEGNEEYDAEFRKMMGPPTPTSVFLYTLGSTVTTSPFLGLRSAFDASDVIVNLPTMNEDLKLLKEHVELQKQLCCRGIQLPDRPIIELSGKIEGIVYTQEDWQDAPARSDINLSSVRLDILAEVSHGVHGFMAFNMDNSTLDIINNSNLDIQLAGQASRIMNSRVFISRAFITLGDLNCSPFYFTIGQMFVPFGRYASYILTSPLTLELGRTNERAALLGIYDNGLYASLYAFRGETDIGENGIDEGGANIGYEYKNKCCSINLGMGFITDIADATSFQRTGAGSGFFGFGLNAFTEQIDHRVPAVDFHAELACGQVGFNGEYITATREFAFDDLNFNGDGAQPAALHLEGYLTFKLCNRFPGSFALAFDRSWETLALLMPEESCVAALNISLWKNTIESFEFRHDKNFAEDDTAGGRGAVPSDSPVFIDSIGGSRNTFTMQIGVYF